MKKIIRKIRLALSLYLFDPFLIPARFAALAGYFKDLGKWKRLNPDGPFRFTMGNAVPLVSDAVSQAAGIRGHYFFQDVWAAKIIIRSKAAEHVDVGSSMAGFVAPLLSSGVAVKFVDIRPLDVSMEGLTCIPGSITDLPFETGSQKSLSSLHVLEHIGLGRYGDPLDPAGHAKAAKELVRVLEPGGRLLIGVPVGRERLCFNAHRVFDPQHVVDLFAGCRLIEFAAVPDSGDRIIAGLTPAEMTDAEFACGLYYFVKEDK